jgi:hypothetical protein
MPDVLSPNVGRSWLADELRHQRMLIRVSEIRIIFRFRSKYASVIGQIISFSVEFFSYRGSSGW